MIDESSAFVLAATRSLGPWFAVWSIRYKWKLDRKLSPNARMVRWGVVISCYSLAWRPNSGGLRVVILLAGLTFLCWPNFAYYATRIFEKWPTTEGKVSSSLRKGPRISVDYYFEFQGQRYGGTSKFKAANDARYSEGTPVIVRFDPLNPDVSSVTEHLPPQEH